jgi:hypothetical protein
MTDEGIPKNILQYKSKRCRDEEKKLRMNMWSQNGLRYPCHKLRKKIKKKSSLLILIIT